MTADSNGAQLFYQKGLKEAWQENYVAALTFFQKAKEKNPQDADACFWVAFCYDMLHRYEEAITAYKQAILIKPNAITYLFLGMAYDNLGHYAEAIEAFKLSVQINPNDASTYRCLGAAYGQLGLYEKALEASKQAIRVKPNDAGAHYNLGMAYLSLGDKGSALDEYEILKSLDAEKANKLFNLIYK
jgi:tetratricopeptide (TPR) repeat protein